MISLKASIGETILILFLFYIYSIWYKQKRYNRIAHEHGCAPPCMDGNKLPFGFDHLWIILAYKGSDILEDVLIPPFRKLGHTYCQSVLGQRTFHTRDDRNLQTIMGTGWRNSGLAPVRLNAFRPLMNQGIL